MDNKKNILLKKKINNLKNKNKHLKDEIINLHNTVSCGFDRMAEYFDKYYIGSSRNYFSEYLKYKYGKYSYDFEKTLWRKNYSYQPILDYSFSDIEDIEDFYTSRNIISFYIDYNNDRDYAWESLYNGFIEINILSNLKSLNNYLDKKFEEFKKNNNIEDINEHYNKDDKYDIDDTYEKIYSFYKTDMNETINNVIINYYKKYNYYIDDYNTLGNQLINLYQSNNIKLNNDFISLCDKNILYCYKITLICYKFASKCTKYSDDDAYYRFIYLVNCFKELKNNFKILKKNFLFLKNKIYNINDIELLEEYKALKDKNKSLYYKCINLKKYIDKNNINSDSDSDNDSDNDTDNNYNNIYDYYEEDNDENDEFDVYKEIDNVSDIDCENIKNYYESDYRKYPFNINNDDEYDNNEDIKELKKIINRIGY